jgi:hypothetical protein
VALGVAGPDLLELAVALVVGEALDEAFGRQQLLAALPDSSVDVGRRPALVGDRLDRPEVVLAGRTGQEAAVSLEVRIELLAVARGLLEVGAVLVALPDLDDGIAQRLALGVEELAGEMRDLADGRRNCVVDDQQVVVGVERELRREEGPLVGGGVRVNSSAKAPRAAVMSEAPRASVPRNARRPDRMWFMFFPFSPTFGALGFGELSPGRDGRWPVRS